MSGDNRLLFLTFWLKHRALRGATSRYRAPGVHKRQCSLGAIWRPDQGLARCANIVEQEASMSNKSPQLFPVEKWQLSTVATIRHLLQAYRITAMPVVDHLPMSDRFFKLCSASPVSCIHGPPSCNKSLTPAPEVGSPEKAC
jgi:hypothetical protein